MNFQVTLRSAVKIEQRRIRRLIRKSRLNPMGLDWRRFILAVDKEGMIIGCVQAKPHRDGSHELASLVVEPKNRGLGIARMLVEKLVNNHEGDLYLMCRSTLGDFYQQFGFEPVKEFEMPDYFRRVSRIASFARFFNIENTLLVMKRKKKQT